MTHTIPTAEFILVAMWFIWWQRRQRTRGETVQTPNQTAISIQVLATNFVRAHSPNQPIRRIDHVWKKPSAGVVKINVDASFHEDKFTGACGAVAREDHGKFLGATTHVLPHVSSVGSAELFAIRCGLYLAAKLGCMKLIIESDSLTALEAISDPNAYMGVDVPIIAECSLMSMDYTSISFDYCTREANLIADGLAKHCFSISKSEEWETLVPDFILHHYVNDLAVI